ncbi:MAG: S8 family peptidase [Vicinamibacterales bacterium]
MRRYLVLIALVIAALTSWPAQTHGQRFPSLSDDLATLRGDRVRVIVQGDEPALSAVRRRHARGHRRDLTGGVALELTKAEFESLKRDSSVTHISGDLPVTANMAITNKVTLADKVWQGTSGLLGLLGTPGYNGTGINVAVIDSGIAPHSALGSRVVARVNLVTSEPGVTGDPFGHGTHVAGMIGGSASAAKYVTSAYTGGSAPGIKFVDVRVLGRTGVGYTSEVIAGIDWAIANRTKYNIRVLNLSLGHPVAESFETDPLCHAVERAVNAGIVVVASAGNYGLTPTGAPILGGITSPGNSPHALTVGAVDTKGTVDRSDDVVAPYSSRGPTRFDWTVKPDIVAPGTRIVSLEAAGSYIAATYPAWHVAGSGHNAYNRLSGTSMSTAVVSGGVALLLDAYPGLSPAQVKLLLQSGARFVPSGGLIAGGTGSVDFSASVKLADNGLVSTLLSAVQNLLGLSSGASFRDRGTLIDRIYDRSGINLLSILNLSALLGGADGADYGVLNLLGEQNSLGRTPANYVVWGSVADWSSSYYVVWGSSMQSPSGQYVVWGSSMYGDDDYVVWGSGQFPEDRR